ncbi:MFS transporter [Streptomyces sp. NPDC059552]|uniref:MFS transporter n=1 Tax=Streptomyces sp. NPDC059552 TaxID=3346862 RepID=UPI0036B97361
MKSDTLIGPLKDPRFRLLWIGQTFSHLGSAVLPLALSFALIGGTGSAADLGLVLASSALSQLVFMLIGGVWSDRLPRRAVMLTADIVRCAVHVALGIELVAGTMNLAHLVAGSALVGAATAFFLPASTGLVPATTEPGVLQQANALMSVSRRAAVLLGPALATTVTVVYGAGWALILDGFTFAVSVVTLLLLRVPHTPIPRKTFTADLRDGWAEVRGRRWLWTNIIGHGVWNLCRTVFFTVGAMVVIRDLGGEVAWGAIAQGGTIGAFIGALIALRIKPRRPLIAANILLALGALPVALIAAHADIYLIVVAGGLMTLSLGLSGTLWDTTIQQQVPERKLSRVSSFDWLVSLALNPIGMALSGSVAVAIGASATLYGAAALMVISGFSVLLVSDVRRVLSVTPEPDGGKQDLSVLSKEK